MAEVTGRIAARTDLARGVRQTRLGCLFADGDRQAHRVEIHVTQDGAPLPLEGCAVRAYFIRADGVTVTAEGTARGSTAAVTLPAACYAAAGRFQLIVKAGQGDADTSVFWGTGTVTASATDRLADPEERVLSLPELLAQIERMEQASGRAEDASQQASQASAEAGSAAIKAEQAASRADAAAGKAETSADALEYVMGEALTAAAKAESAAGRAESAASGTETPVSFGGAQQLTDAEQETARQNIGAAPAQALASVAEVKAAANRITPVTDVIHANNTDGAVCSDVVAPVSGHTYFGYALAAVSSIQGYTGGHLCLRFLHAGLYDCLEKIAGNSAQPFREGELELYGTFTAGSAKTVKAVLRSFNSASAYTYDAQLTKLYLWDLTEAHMTEEEALALAREGAYAAVRWRGEIAEGRVDYRQLSEGLRSQLAATGSNIVDCWGDSLTQGTSRNAAPYPKALQEMLGSSFTVNNYGCGGENAEEIAFRQGGLPALCQPFRAGASASDENPVTLHSLDGQSLNETMGRSGWQGNGVVYLDGGDKYLLRRNDAGLFLYAGDGALLGKAYDRPVLARAEGRGTGHVALFCVGQNGWATEDPADLAELLSAMARHNNGPYLVIGRPTGDAESRRAEERTLALRFGARFVNARAYLSAYGLQDAGLSPSAEDEAATARGAVPPALRLDGVHLTDGGCCALAKCVCLRGRALGFWR